MIVNRQHRKENAYTFLSQLEGKHNFHVRCWWKGYHGWFIVSNEDYNDCRYLDIVKENYDPNQLGFLELLDS